MSDKLKAAEAMAKAVREHSKLREKFKGAPNSWLDVVSALAAYEAAPAESLRAESQSAEGFAAGEGHTHPWPHDFQLAQWFHETYERLAPSFGYETRKDSAKPWEEVPEKNKKLMTAVCREILIDLSKAKLAAAQARIASLEHMQEISSAQIRAGAERIRFADNQRDELKSRVAVLENALEGAREAFIKYEMDVEDSPPYHHRQLMERINAALASQPSREKEGV